MSAALLAVGYAAAVAWCVPVGLSRLTADGVSARLGLAAWLAAMLSVLTGLVAAAAFLLRAAVAHWSWLAEAVCRSVTGRACAAAMYRSAALELAVSLTAIIVAVTAATMAWRYGRRVRRARRQTRAHAEVARIAGRPFPASGSTVVLDDRHPVAYCVPGRPATIVLTTGALAVLDDDALAAVLAHERAHLAGRHHLLLTLTRGLTATFPLVPVFIRGPAQVARLAEMCADDAAARQRGRPALLAALLTMGTGQAIPTAALGATAGPIAARVQRLIDPPPQARQARNRLALTAVMALLVVATALVTAYGR